MRQFLFAILSTLLICVIFAVPTQARIWTHISGKSSIEGELAEQANGKVKLRKPDGKFIILDESQLSKQDTNYLKYKKYRESRQSQAEKQTASQFKSDKLPEGVKLEILSLAVKKVNPFLKGEPDQTGTSVELLLTSEKERFIGLNLEQTKLSFLKDSRSLNISGFKNLAITHHVSENGKQMFITLFSQTIPPPLSQSFTINGTLSLEIPMDTPPQTPLQAADHEVDVLKENTLQFENQQVVVKKLPDDDFMEFATDLAKLKVVFTSDKPLDLLKEMALMGPNNEPLTYCEGEKSEIDQEGKKVYLAEYYLTELVDHFCLTLKTKDSKTVTESVVSLPVSLEVGLGL